MYVRKAERASIASQNTRYSTALRLASQAWSGPKFEEDAEGRRIRIWGNGYEDWVRDEDVRNWLLGLRVVEDLRDGLEFCREAYIANMVKQDYLRLDPTTGFYWITAKAAERYGLPKVMGRKFPK
jgi:hypothetical protein